MKQKLQRIALSLLCLTMCVMLSAQSVTIGGISYYVSTEKDGTKYAYLNNTTNECAGDVVIPDYVTCEGKNYPVKEISFAAFASCGTITSLTIPNTMTSINFSAFSLMNKNALTAIYVKPENPSYYSEDGVLFSKDKSLLYLYPQGRKGAYTIPNSVTRIFQNAFNSCTGLSTLIIGSNVKSIDDNSFSGCSILYEIYNLSSLNIVAGDYGNGGVAGNAKVVHTSLSEPSLIETSGDFVFMDSDNPTLLVYTGKTAHLTLPNHYKGKTYTIGQNVFMKNKELTSIVIPEGVTEIGHFAFSDCSNLTSVSIPKSMKSIGSCAFANCFALTKSEYVSLESLYNISFADASSNPLFSSGLSKHLYIAGKEVTNLVIPSTMTSIGKAVFAGCSSVTSITIPTTITSIGDYAFYGCSALTSLSISGSVNNVGRYAFGRCSNLSSITIPSGISSISDGMFSGCRNLTTVTIPNNITSIGGYAFSDCSNLTSVTIGKNVTSIGDRAFDECTKLYEVYNLSSLSLVQGNNTNGKVAYYARVIHTSLSEASIYYKQGDFQFVTSGTPTLIAYTGSASNVVLPSKCNGLNYGISEKVFYGHKELTTVTIPEGVISIGRNAFRDCSALTSVTIPGSVTSLGTGIFPSCN